MIRQYRTIGFLVDINVLQLEQISCVGLITLFLLIVVGQGEEVGGGVVWQALGGERTAAAVKTLVRERRWGEITV